MTSPGVTGSRVVLALVVASCTLTTSLEGLVGGRPQGLDGGVPDGNADAAEADAIDASAADVLFGDAPPNDGPDPDRAMPPDTGPDTPVGSRYQTAVMADAPLAYWRLGEGSGASARDEIGNAHRGTFSGVFTRNVPGAVGDGDTATSFDGSTTRLDIGNSFAFAGTSAFSLEMWVNAAVVGPDVRVLASRNVSDGGAKDGYALYFGDTWTLFSRFSNGTENGYASGPTLPAGRFVHLVATYDGSRSHLYMDGMLVGTGVTTSPLTDSAGILAFGDSASGAFFKFQGVMDEIAIYGAALSAERVLGHYHASGR